MKSVLKLELEEAKLMIEAAKKKSEEINVLETIAIVDDGGNLLALERMNGARITGPEISIAKAYSESDALATLQKALAKASLTLPSAA